MSAIIKKELRVYFTTMTGYIFLAAFVVSAAFLFVFYNLQSGLADFSYSIFGTLNVFLILVPVLTMRLFSDEAKQGTDQLLYTSPVNIRTIVSAKFVGAIILFLIGYAMIMTFPLLLSMYGTVPYVKIMAVSIGYILLIASFISVGVFISSLTSNQIIAAAGTFGAMFAFIYMDSITTAMPTSRGSSIIFLAIIGLIIAIILFDSTKNLIPSIIFIIICALGIGGVYFYDPTLLDSTIYNVLSWFSPVNRFVDASAGIINTSDIIYFISFIIAFLYFTINNIEKRRWK